MIKDNKDWLAGYSVNTANEIGVVNAILLHCLYNKYKSHSKNKSLTKNGEFFATSKDIQEVTSLSDKQIKLAIEKLVALGYISVVVKGLPQKRYFKILNYKEISINTKGDDQLIPKGLIKNDQTSELINTKGDEQLIPKVKTIKNINKKDKEKDIFLRLDSEQAPSPNKKNLSSSDFDKFRVPNKKDDFGDDIFYYSKLVNEYKLENMDKDITIPEAKICKLLCCGLLVRVSEKCKQTDEEVENTLNSFKSYHTLKNTFKNNMKVEKLLNIVQSFTENTKFIRN